MSPSTLTVDVSAGANAIPGGSHFMRSCWVWGCDPCLETVNLMSNCLSSYIICAHGRVKQILVGVSEVVSLWALQDRSHNHLGGGWVF